MSAIRWIGLVLLIILGLILLWGIYHQVMLMAEKKKLVPNGQLVDVDGGKMHVFKAGPKTDWPTLVFLSGYGIPDPAYHFKPIWEPLAKRYRVAVVEKFGYGYSELSTSPRDVDTLLGQSRKALEEAGVKGPFVLCPHSLSGLEAIRWAQLYPKEVAGIVGLDMCIPSLLLSKEEESVKAKGHAKFMAFLLKLGITRIPGHSKIENLHLDSLTKEEQLQGKYLSLKNPLNPTLLAEMEAMYDNARTVLDEKPVTIPFELLVGGKASEFSEAWKQAQQDFAAGNGGKVKIYDELGHFLHHEKPQAIINDIDGFVEGLL